MPARVHQAARALVPGIDTIAPVRPRLAPVLPSLGVVAIVLQQRQDRLVARAKIVLRARDAVVAVVPRHVAHATNAVVPGLRPPRVGVLQELREVLLHARHVLVVAGGQQKQARHAIEQRVLLHPVRARIELRRLLDDLLRLGRGQREALAVRAQHRNLDGHRLAGPALARPDFKGQHAVGGLGPGQRIAQHDQRVPALELLAVDAQDDVALGELARGRGVRQRLFHRNDNAFVNPRLDAGDPDRPELILLRRPGPHAEDLRLRIVIRRVLGGFGADRHDEGQEDQHRRPRGSASAFTFPSSHVSFPSEIHVVPSSLPRHSPPRRPIRCDAGRRHRVKHDSPPPVSPSARPFRDTSGRFLPHMRQRPALSLPPARAAQPIPGQVSASR